MKRAAFHALDIEHHVAPVTENILVINLQIFVTFFSKESSQFSPSCQDISSTLRKVPDGNEIGLVVEHRRQFANHSTCLSLFSQKTVWIRAAVEYLPYVLSLYRVQTYKHIIGGGYVRQF